MTIRSVSRRRTCPLLGPVALLWAVSSTSILSGQSPAPAAPAPELVLLEPGPPITRSISGGQSHAYRFHLDSGQFVDLVVDQLGVDVGLTLAASDGKKVGDLDSPNGNFGPEPLCWLAAAAGDYRLDVTAGAPRAPEGRYRITIRVRQPGPSDRMRADAQALFFEAEGLRGQGASEAFEKAAVLHERAAGLFRDAGDVAGQARALFYLASVKDLLGLTPENDAWLRKVLELAPTLRDRGVEASVLTWLGLATHHLGDPTAALAYFDRAVEIEERVGDGALLGLTSACRAQVCMFVGDHEGASRNLARAYELNSVYGDQRTDAVNLNDMALNASDVGEYDEALRLYERAIAIEQEIGDKNNEAISRNNLGNLYGSLGRWDKALEQHELALPLRRAIGTKYGEAYTLNNLGVAHGKLGAIDKAEAELAAALEIRRQVGDRHGEATTLQALGIVRFETGRPAEALSDFDRSLEIRRVIADLEGQAETLASIARASRSLGQLETALRRAEEAVAVVESQRLRVARSFRPAYLGSARPYYELEIDLRMSAVSGDSGAATRGFETSERAKARGLIELLAESRANIREGVDATLVARDLSVRRSLASKLERQTRLLAGAHTESQASEAAAAVEALVHELRQLEDSIRKASPRYAALTNAEPLGARAVQDLLDVDTVLIAYSLGEERSWLWTIAKDSVAGSPLPGRSRIESAARKLYDSWRERPGPSGRRPTDSAAAADVSAMLLAPAADRIAGKRLVIVPDGALAFLPFAAVPIPGAPARPLSAEHEIVVLPSASTLGFLRSGPPRANPSKTLAVIADPVFDRDDPRVRNRVAVAHTGPERAKDESRSRSSVERSVRDADVSADTGKGFRLERLSFTRREAKAILDLVPASSRHASLDFDADRETALRDLSSYRFVHFATHAFSNALHPELSGLVLSLVDREGRPREGFVPASEVFNLSLSADLVVLSACRTALGKEVRGEGLVGLTRAFMYAGSPRVVASLWRVDDAATAELMTRFYAEMLGPKKLRPAAALREAQARVRAQSRWSDPYYWAGFVLQGDWR